MFKAIPLFLFASLVVVACAGNRPPDASTPAGGGDAQGKASSWSVDSQRESFMEQCTAKVKAPDYCACGFDQFREVFKDSPPQDSDASKEPRLATLAERTKTNCASKLPEDLVKSGFVTACVGDEKRKAAFCDCEWATLRKSLAVSDFATDFEGPRFDDAKKAVAKTCKGKLSGELAKASFVQDCTKGDAGKAKNCECAWKKLHAKYSAEEILVGAVNLDQVPGLAECK
jgi:hypothetical protein